MSSDGSHRSSSSEAREAFAKAFNRDKDPLAEYSAKFANLPDPFDYFVEAVLENRESIESKDTVKDYRRDYRQWRRHMEATDRHPACPSVSHVQSYIEWRRDVKGNGRRTIQAKLNHLSQALKHWQSESVFPHDDYNPFQLAKEITDLGSRTNKPYPDLSLETLQEEFEKIGNIRSRAIIGLQLKLGLRAGEVSNIKLSDIHLAYDEVQKHYPNLSTCPEVSDHSNVLYIPHDRDGNKSSNPRLLPLDNELQWLLFRYLIIRPQVDEPYTFLSRRSYSKLNSKGVNRVWKEEFHPDYEETNAYRAITSHYGRHWFSSYWKLEQNLEREHIQYMRGDRVQPIENFGDAIDEYLHPRYGHIESALRRKSFSLGVPRQHRP